MKTRLYAYPSLAAVEKSPEAVAVAIQEFLGANKNPTLPPRHEYGEV